ncbi:MAG TPA: glutathione peroxidase [Gemmataceae bacterium]|nr:glutathione peroxidase [Gemmataceae bacterium]
MRTLGALLAAVAVLSLCIPLARAEGKKGDKKVPAVLNFKMKGIDGKEVDLSQYQGKVVLFVNVASKCGYTPQYKGLQALYEKYKDQGLVVVGVPANDFNKQEPGTDAEIAKFCESKYGVTFPMLAKVSTIVGDDKVPLYKHLTSKDTDPKFAGEVKWNFTKFLIGRNGDIVNRFDSKVKPDSDEMTKAIEDELAKKK